jgi:DNA (cytosine-5)-methyltransferase 1
MNYYNEWDKFAAQWLRELITDGLIPEGQVDTRSIADIEPEDLAGYAQCHFFSGIGGWPRALELAAIQADFPIWTGSCPCQPFSSAGKRAGAADERNLWPVWFELIRVCKPAAVVGEQVASAIAMGWLD